MKILPAMLKGITLRHDRDHYSIICFYSFKTEQKRQSHEES